MLSMAPGKGHELAAYFHWYDDEWEPAIDEYHKAIAIDSTNAESHYMLGVCYRNVEESQRAMHHLKKAIDKNRILSPAWKRR